MGINRKNAIQEIFNRLENYVSPKIDRELPSGERFIKMALEDKEFLNKAKLIARSELLSNTNASLVGYNDGIFLVVVGDNFSGNITSDEILVEEEITPGFFSFISHKLGLRVNTLADSEEIYNDILWQQEEDNYDGHECHDIYKYFENIAIYKLEGNSNLIKDDIYNIFCYYCIINKQLLKLEFSDDVINSLESLILCNNKCVPYHNIAQALLASQWGHAFLETYRCIERMFHIVTLKKFHERLNSSKSLLEISKDIEEIIGWRPREEDAIFEIFNILPTDIVDMINSVKVANSEDKDIKIYKWYYRVRNSIAHFRPIHEPIRFTNEQWDNLLNANTKIIKFLYKQYEKIL